MRFKEYFFKHTHRFKCKLRHSFRYFLTAVLSDLSAVNIYISSLYPQGVLFLAKVRVKADKARGAAARKPYILPSFALIALFFISLILFSTTTEQESFASVAKVLPADELHLPVRATLRIENPPIIAAKADSTTTSHYVSKYDPPDIDSLRELFAYNSPGGISRGAVKSGELSLTFDGGWSDHAREILDILREKEIKTTFFLTGRFIRRNPELVIEIINSGHEVGNHTYSHPHLTDFNKSGTHKTLPKVTKEYFMEQLNTTAKLFKELTGEDIAPYWRAPFGEINRDISTWALEAGYVHVGWTRDYKNHTTLDSLDWVNDTDSQIYYTAKEIKERILEFDNEAYGLNGAIILMHLGTKRRRDRAVSVLAEMIDEIRLRGLSFVKVSRIAQNLIEESQDLENKIVLKGPKGPLKYQ